jgi:hypothetical protein
LKQDELKKLSEILHQLPGLFKFHLLYISCPDSSGSQKLLNLNYVEDELGFSNLDLNEAEPKPVQAVANPDLSLELVSIWSKAVPKLREVKLVKEYVWRKSIVKSKWEKWYWSQI